MTTLLTPSNLAGKPGQRIAEALFWLILIGVGSLILPDYGMGWDEPTRWASGDLKLDYYAGFAESEDWWAHMQTAPHDTYPGLFDMTLALAARTLPLDRFLLGHVFSFLFGLAGLVAVRLLAAKLVRAPARRWVGLGAAAILLLLPSYFGHLFINPKDIPFAATMAWGLFGLVHFVEELPRPSWKRTLLFGLAVGVAMSTRLPAGILLAYAAVLAALWLLLALPQRSDWPTFLGQVGGIALRGLVAAGVAFVFLLPWWPAMHHNPFSMSVEAVERLHFDSTAIPVLFRGAMFEAGTTPRSYAFWMFFVTSPLWFLGALASGALVAGRRGRAWLDGFHREPDSRAWQVLAVLLAAGFPMLYVTLAHPAIHNGFRHLIYVLPPLAVLASWNLLEVARFLSERGVRPLWQGSVAGLVAASAVFALMRLHPYEYVFANALVGGPAGTFGRYETEYWFTSTKHGLEQLSAYLEEHPEEVPVGRPTRVLVTGPWQVAKPFLPPSMEMVGDVNEADFVIANTQMMVHLLFHGEAIIQIERDGLPILVVFREASPTSP